VRTTLTIAGSDSSGGAGIQADLKTFHRFGTFGMSALTLITAQNTLGVDELYLLPPPLVSRQIHAVAADLPIHAAKTGALGAAPIVEAVAQAVRRHAIAPLVVDPVMISKHGAPLMAPEAVASLRSLLLPLASLVTPNVHEASALCGRPVRDEAEMGEAARAIHGLGAAAVLVKGGALESGEAVDVLFDGRQILRFPAPRIASGSTHGSGCTYAAAIAALLALGNELPAAVAQAKSFMTRAIASAPALGHGRGPVNHWASTGP
jgi:hydroxymethylpyrimidine/phosphomethylpyrimidine kinase